MILPIKRKWFDMILSGEKKEEYREIKPYYETRFTNLFKMTVKDGKLIKILDPFMEIPDIPVQTITFRNGYSKDSPALEAECTLSVGKGKPEWGAKPDEEYYILHIRSARRIYEQKRDNTVPK